MTNPPTDPGINQLMDDSEAFVREIMTNRGSVAPQFVLRIGQAMVPILAEFQDTRSKNNTVALVRLMTTVLNPQSVSFVAESWMSQAASEADARSTPPSQSPDRKEAVVVQVSTPIDERMRLLLIERDENGGYAHLNQMGEDESGASGRFSNIYPDRPPSPEEHATAREILEQCIGTEAVADLMQYASPYPAGARA